MASAPDTTAPETSTAPAEGLLATTTQTPTEPVEKPEDKPAETPAEKPADAPADKPDEDKEAASAVPEKYELTAPEGMTIDETILAEADPIFRELGLSNEQADKLMPLAGSFAQRLFAAQQDAFQGLATDWAKQAKADPDIGGTKWAETEGLVAKALDRLGEGGTALRQVLDETKLCNHPEMIRMLRNVGARISEDTEFPRGGDVQVKKTGEAALYGAEFQPKS